MNPSLWDTMITNLPNLSAFVAMTLVLWYNNKRLQDRADKRADKIEKKYDRCEEARESLTDKLSEALVRIATLEATLNIHKPGG